MPGSRPWPDVHRVVAGEVGVNLAPEGLRHLTVRGREVAADVYAAVRARDWGTLSNAPVTADLDVGGYGITLRREETVGDHPRVDAEQSDLAVRGWEVAGPPPILELAVLVPAVGSAVLASAARTAALRTRDLAAAAATMSWWDRPGRPPPRARRWLRSRSN